MPNIEEKFPDVISQDIIRACIEFEPGADPANVEDRRRVIAFSMVASVNLGFKNLRRIENLQGLQSLTKLQLDNNSLTKIENIGHLTNLTWLDLSFNKLTVIEGIATLTKLTDLSLTNNSITDIVGTMDSLEKLNVLSIGSNQIKELTQVLYLRRFRQLQLLNMAGNPIAKDPEYKSYVLSHTFALKFLDYRLIDSASVQSALESYQDEMLELAEREAAESVEEAAAADRVNREEELKAANLGGIEGLYHMMIKNDPEQAKLQMVGGLLEGAKEMEDQWAEYEEQFIIAMRAKDAEKKAEAAIWQEALEGLIVAKEAEARALIEQAERTAERALAQAEAALAGGEEQALVAAVAALRKQRNEDAEELQDALMAVEAATVDGISDFVSEFDVLYTELSESAKGVLNGYFNQIRDLENIYFERVTAQTAALLERAVATADAEDGGGITDEARSILSEKDSLNNSLQASHDSHLTAIDGAEDRLASEEKKRYEALLGTTRAWEYTRNRDRISEIIGLLARFRERADKVLAEMEAVLTA